MVLPISSDFHPCGVACIDERADLCRGCVMGMCQDLWPAHWAMTESRMPIDIARLLGETVPALPPPVHCALQQAHAERQPAATDEAGAQHAQQQAPRAAMQSRRLRSDDSAKGKSLARGNRLEIQVDAGSSAIRRSPIQARPSPAGLVGQAKGDKAAEAHSDARDGRTANLQRPACPTGRGPASAPKRPRASQKEEVILLTCSLTSDASGGLPHSLLHLYPAKPMKARA